MTSVVLRRMVAPLGLSLCAISCRDATSHRAPPPARSLPEAVAVQPDARLGFALSPNPLLSRKRPVEGWSAAHFPRLSNLVDGDPRTWWSAGKPTAARPAWAAIDVGVGPSAVLLTWTSGGSFDYAETDYGSPGAYRIETSADSTDGHDGTWTTVAEEPAVTTHARTHRLDFRGKRWVKLVITGTPEKSPNGVQIDEIEIHDASAGAADTWFFMGDSITAFAFGRATKASASFAARVHEKHPRYSPIVIGGGMGGEKADQGLRHLDDWLERNPEARFWGLTYGTNDSAGNSEDTSVFRASLRTIVERLQLAGRVPILATIPFASDGQHQTVPRFNAVILQLRETYGLPPGPDLYAWFAAHPDQLRDGLHPNEAGIEAMNRLWADAVDPLYPH